ncbi:class I SAM-dependent methyltransferase [Candidatus Thorarchaeota archaeon]|nr:MAG: class I SAM-dependent methyltransferase [Candidatus Thorarchaeota archaeon]
MNTMNSFDDITLAYDNSIDWDRRLNRELPLILSLMDDPKRARVLDMACGSGHHSIALAAHGAEVIGFDSSETMIRAARVHMEEKGTNAQFINAEMENIANVVEGQFDLVICLGNSLALLKNREVVKDVVKGVRGILREGGSFLAQVLNFEEIHWTGFRNFPMKKGRLSNGNEITFARLFEHTDYPFSSTLVMSAFREVDGVWTSEVETQKVLNLNYELMKEILEVAGFTNAQFYSDYSKNLLERKNHRNMIIHAVK